MPQTANDFIDRLEFLGLLEDSVLENLRRRVAESKKPVSPQWLASLLVDQGHLTQSQAKKLAGDETAASAAPAPGPAPALLPVSSPSEVAIPAPPAPGSPVSEIPIPPPPAPVATASTRAGEIPPPPPPTNPPKSASPPAPQAVAAPKTDNDDLWLAATEDHPDIPAKSGAPAPSNKDDDDDVVDLLEVAPAPAPAKEPSPRKTTAKPKSTSPAPPASPKAAAPPAAPPPPADGLTPIDSISDLVPLGDSGGLATLPDSSLMPSNLTSGKSVDLLGDPLLAPLGQAGGSLGPAGLAPKSAATAVPKKQTRTRSWDAPLFLIGGGALVFLLIAMVFIYLILARGSADKLFEEAEKLYREQSYEAADATYARFLAGFPKDGKASLARVRRGMCRLRPLVESKNWASSLKQAQEVLPEIESESAFSEARAELATLLPDIAAGFASRARIEQDTSKSQGFVDQAEESLKLVNNSAYIPTALRLTATIEPRIRTIQENVGLARRDINRDRELNKSLEEIAAFVKGRKTGEAYAVRKQLIKNYPDLEANADLRRAVLLITEAEREEVKPRDAALSAVTEDEPSAAEFRVVLAATNGPGMTGVEGRQVLVLARGAVYGLDAVTGRVLWRRFVGFETKVPPQLLSNQPGADALLVDGRRNELVRVNAATGKLVWRLAIGGPFAGPAVSNDRIFVSTHSGRVIQIDPAGGQSLREAAFPQSLAVEPGLEARGRVVYQMGEHSNIYVLKVDSLACESVFYVGHKAGSVVVPPLLAQGSYLFVAENAGPDYCLLHVILTDTGDAGLKEAQEPLRLKGRVIVPMAVSGRRVVVVTDLGEISLLEIDAAAKQPVSPVVRFGPTSKEPVLGYPLADEGLMWLADRRLAKYELQAARGELVRKSIIEEGHTFVAPLERLGDAVVHTRRRRNSTGVSIAASQIDTDQPLWQTDLATPLAGPVQIDAAKNRLVAISAHAEFHYIDQAAIQAGLSGKPATVIGANTPGLTFTRLVELGADRLALTSDVDNEKAVVFDPAAEFPTRLVKLVFPANSAVGEPILFRGGLLRPSSQGRVHLLDLKSGGDQVHPFQPRLSPGEAMRFSRPAAIGPDKNEFVVADSRKRLYRVGIKDQPQPNLAELAQVETAAEIVSPLAAAGDTLYGVTRPGPADALVTFHLPDLKAGQETPLSGRVVWGPEQVGELVFFTTDQEGLFCLEAGEKTRWKSPLPYGPLAGKPLADGPDFILASQRGVVWRVAGDSGKEVARVDLGEPLGAGPVAFRGRLLLTGSDGVLHVIRMPEAAK